MLLDRLAAYLGFRARLTGEGMAGASLDELELMARRNLALSGLAASCPISKPTLPAAFVRRVAVDGRLHAWEWLVLPSGRLLKSDALDHCESHDLVGCQDISWDVAGASVEFDFSGAEREQLRRAVELHAGRAVHPRLVAFMTIAYLAFQIGYWRLAAQGSEGERAARQARSYEAVCASRGRCWWEEPDYKAEASHG
jgi:hypothetical protein